MPLLITEIVAPLIKLPPVTVTVTVGKAFEAEGGKTLRTVG